MPGSLEGVLAGIPGLGGYVASQDFRQRQDAGQLQQMGALQQIAQRQQAMQQELEMKRILSQAAQAAGGDPEKMHQLLLQSGNPVGIKLAQGLEGHLDRKAKLESDNLSRYEMRQQRLDELTQRGEQEIARVREAAAQQRITKAEADAREASMRENMTRLAASLRPAPSEQPPVAVVGPDGKSVFVNRADAIGKQPAVKETADRVIPQNIAKAYQENSNALRKIDTALAEVDKYPEAFGLQNMRGDAISQRVDPKGVTARAIVADIGSLKIHDRSGAAVTAAETPRLLPFIPNVNDNAATIKKKLALFRKEYDSIQNDIGSMYSPEQGYKSFPSPQTRATDKPANPVDALLEKYK